MKICFKSIPFVNKNKGINMLINESPKTLNAKEIYNKSKFLLNKICIVLFGLCIFFKELLFFKNLLKNILDFFHTFNG